MQKNPYVVIAHSAQKPREQEACLLNIMLELFYLFKPPNLPKKKFIF